MKKEIAELWITALKSDEYKQTRGTLKDEKGYCCLGVLCDLYLKEKDTLWEDLVSLRAKYLPKEVREWSGVQSSAGKISDDKAVKCLSYENDSGLTFVEISAIIKLYQEVL